MDLHPGLRTRVDEVLSTGYLAEAEAAFEGALRIRLALGDASLVESTEIALRETRRRRGSIG